MEKVVKKELIKWLDTSIVYAIYDSEWVNLTQCISKKGGLIVVKNDMNELIPTRTITCLYVLITRNVTPQN